MTEPVFSTFLIAELRSVRGFRAYVCCRCNLKRKIDGRRQKSNVVFSDCLHGFEEHATTKMLAEFALCCVVLPPSIESSVVVSLCCENGSQYCATGCLTFWPIVASRFLSSLSPS